MKKNIFLILFVSFGFVFSANAQSCCSKSKGKMSCAKKTATSSKTTSTKNVKPVLTSSLQADQLTTEQFKVYGNCSMCENRIESAFANVAGVQSADWDVDSKIMTVKFDKDAITLDDIKKKIAAVGHDTDDFQAKKNVYNDLPGCCQYDRAIN